MPTLGDATAEPANADQRDGIGTSGHADIADAPAVPDVDQRELRRALLSVSYHTIGRQFEISGAPSVLLPSDIRPMSLEQALEVIERSSPVRLGEALWRITQSIPVSLATADRPSSHYPVAMKKYLPQGLGSLGKLRRDYRRGSGRFIAGLVAMRDRIFDDADRLIEWVERAPRNVNIEEDAYPTFSQGLREILGCDDIEYLKYLVNVIGENNPTRDDRMSSSERPPPVNMDKMAGKHSPRALTRMCW